MSDGVRTHEVICIGSFLWDIIGRSSKTMRLGSDIAGQITRIPGGVAMNIAMTLIGFGMRPIALTAIGDDAEGEALLKEIASLGIDGRYIYRSKDQPTDCYMAIEGENGVIAAIADAHSLEAAGARILEPLHSGDLTIENRIIALDGNLTPALLGGIAQSPIFETVDLRIAPASPGKAERLTPFFEHKKAVYYVNLEEAQILLGEQYSTAHDAARAIIERGAARAIVTDGAKMIADATLDELITSTPPSVTVKRVTGAGDTFMAAHIAREARGASRQNALEEAAKAAARFVAGEAAV